MRDGWFIDYANDGEMEIKTQSFYDGSGPNAKFLGMRHILEEWGIVSKGKLRECPGFKCRESSTEDCCVWKLLYTQPNFASAKSAVEEVIEAAGHYCIFYPKFHCELNFIEQVWGMAKRFFRDMNRAPNQKQLEKTVIACLDMVPLINFLRYFLSCCIYPFADR